VPISTSLGQIQSAVDRTVPCVPHWLYVRPTRQSPQVPVHGRTPPKGPVAPRGGALFLYSPQDVPMHAFAADWRITSRYAWGNRRQHESKRECHYTRELAWRHWSGRARDESFFRPVWTHFPCIGVDVQVCFFRRQEWPCKSQNRARGAKKQSHQG
jgi:hypothetical protein